MALASLSRALLLDPLSFLSDAAPAGSPIPTAATTTPSAAQPSAMHTEQPLDIPVDDAASSHAAAGQPDLDTDMASKLPPIAPAGHNELWSEFWQLKQYTKRAKAASMPCRGTGRIAASREDIETRDSCGGDRVTSCDRGAAGHNGRPAPVSALARSAQGAELRLARSLWALSERAAADSLDPASARIASGVNLTAADSAVLMDVDAETPVNWSPEQQRTHGAQASKRTRR